MVERIQHIHQVPVAHTHQVYADGDEVQVVHSQNVLARVISFIAGILLVLLAFRFVFSLLGANLSNSFVNFIYTTSHPFVAPFFSVFSYTPTYGVSHFELYTLVAMAVYALIAEGLSRLVTLNRA